MRLRALLCVLALAATAATQDDLQRRLEAARADAAADRAEAAAASLRALRRDVAEIGDAGKRRALQQQIEAELEGIDPLDAKAQPLLDGAARELLRAGQAYVRRKWHRAALPYLRAAADASLRVAGKALAECELAAGGAASTSSTTAVWFDDGLTFSGGGYWKVADGVITSPPPKGQSIGFRSTRVTSGSYRVTMAVRASAEPSKASLAFALKPSVNGDTYLLVELRHAEGFSQLRLLWCANAAFQEIGSENVQLTRGERAGWLDLWADVEGDRVQVGLEDLASIEVRSPTPDASGCIGCFVSGDTPFAGSVSFRDLRVQVR